VGVLSEGHETLKSMKVAIVSKADRFGGGASRVAEDLCVLLQASGHTAHHYLSSAVELKPYMKPLYGGSRVRRGVGLAHHVTQRLGLQEIIPWEYLVLRLQHGLMDYDIIHFHDLSTAISPMTVRLAARRIPTVWTFHDYAAFTGGCIFPMDCTKYRTGCGTCPQLHLWPLNRSKGSDFTRLTLRLKQNMFQRENIHVVAPCEWMAITARASGTDFKHMSVIPYGIDTVLYRNVDKTAIRQQLGIQTRKPIVLLSAGDITDKRKGTVQAIEVLRRSYPQIDPLVLVVGKITQEARLLFDRIEVIETGYLTDDARKAGYFAAADVFLFCPVDDNMPLTILETMATGTPMVGFATGGIPEVVQHDLTGFLVAKGDVQSAADGLHAALQQDRRLAWTAAGRSRVERYYSHEIFLKNHLDLYTRLRQSR